MKPLRQTDPATAVYLSAAVRAALASGGAVHAASPDYVAGFTRAVEFVARRLGCSVEDAADLLLDRSVAEGTSLGDLAIGVIDGRVRFDV
jgi:hypothetical protein